MIGVPSVRPAPDTSVTRPLLRPTFTVTASGCPLRNTERRPESVAHLDPGRQDPGEQPRYSRLCERPTDIRDRTTWERPGCLRREI
jgi:hypothetical protein